MNGILKKALDRRGFTLVEDLAFQKGVVEYLYNKGRFKKSLEIGYFFGRTSVIPLSFNPEKHYIVEQFWDEPYFYGQQEDRENPCVEVWPSSSQKLPSSKIDEILYSIDYVFIDGEHTREALKNDLLLASKVLTRHGIIVVDDVQKLFPTHIAAVEEFCKEHEFLKIFSTDTQVYLCRPAHFEEYYNYFLLNLPRQAIEDIGEELDCGFSVYSGTSSTDDACFPIAPFFMIFRDYNSKKKLEYFGEADHKIEYAKTFPIIERKDLHYLDIEK